jgi:sugar-phosphatase
MAAPHLDAEAEARAFVPGEESTAETMGPLTGAARLLQTLPEDTWAVATSGLRASATSRLRRAGLAIPGVLVCAEDVARGKPSPEAYLAAAAGLGVAPLDCLVFEDAPAGVQAAKAAGMTVIGLTTTHRPDQLGADVCAATLAGVHLGRIDRDARGRPRLEILVVEL